jgi:hypothetical protein
MKRDADRLHITREERDLLLKLLTERDQMRAILQQPEESTDLIERLQQLTLDLTPLDRYYLHEARGEASDEVNIDDDAALSHTDDGCWVQAWLYIGKPDAQWITFCPACDHHALIVESAVLLATGQRVDIGTELSGDGFVIRHEDAQVDGSTEDEIVRCPECGEQYTLGDLALDKET